MHEHVWHPSLPIIQTLMLTLKGHFVKRWHICKNFQFSSLYLEFVVRLFHPHKTAQFCRLFVHFRENLQVATSQRIYINVPKLTWRSPVLCCQERRFFIIHILKTLENLCCKNFSTKIGANLFSCRNKIYQNRS